MGNTQSAEAPRKPPTKLTKPRTNTSTTNLLGTASPASRRTSKLDLLEAPNKRSSTLSIDAVVVADDAAVNGKPDSNPKRRSFFRSKSAQAELTTRAEGHASNITDDAFCSSTLSSIQVEMPVGVGIPVDSRYGVNNVRPPMRNSRTAPLHHPRSHSTLRLSLVVEAQSPEPEPNDDTKQLGAKAGCTEERTLESIIVPTKRSNSLQSMSMPIPIRRRSLLTPGIATRASSKDDPYRKALPPQPVSPVSAMTDDTSSEKTGKRFSFRKSLPTQSVPSSPIMDDNNSGKLGKKYSFRKSMPGQSTPSTDQLREYYYNQSKPTSSPLDQLAVLEPPTIKDPHTRTATPNDLEYGHIGAFKLGSLRITNGAASPAPSSKTRYFDAVPSVYAESSDRQHAPSRLQSELEPDIPRDVEKNYPDLVMDDMESPSEKHRLPDEAPRIAETLVEIPGFSLDLPDFKSTESIIGATSLRSPATAPDIAREYMQEIASSPFSFEESPPPTPRLESTSKHTAMEDNLFDDEPESTVSSTSGSHPDPSRSRDTNEAATSSGMLIVPKVWKNDSQRGRTRAMQGPREPVAKPLEKSDSGYSSKTSLRSSKSHNSLNVAESTSNVSTAPTLPDKDPPVAPPKNQYTSLSAEASAEADTVLVMESPVTEYTSATPTKDWVMGTSPSMVYIPDSMASMSHTEDFSKKLPKPPTKQPPPLPLKQDYTVNTTRRERPPLPIKSIEQTRAAALCQLESSDTSQRPTQARHQSTPVAVTTPTRPPLKTSGSDNSISSINRRLQKYRPARPASFIVQGYREIEPDRIPPISQDAEQHLDERLKNFPLLTHTYKTVHRTNSKETLATIFSVTSSEQRLSRFDGQSPISPTSEHIEESSPSDSDVTKPTNIERFSNVRKIFRRSTDGVRGRRQSVDSKARNRSSSRSSHEISIQDLAAVSRRLGGSPYDHASKALDSRFNKGSRGASPSKRTHERSRSRSKIIGMNAESAARFARDRSRLREELRQQNLQYDRQYEIPMNYIRGRRSSFDDRSEFLGHIPIATMGDGAAPPVPSLSSETAVNPSGVAAAAQPPSYDAVRNTSMPKKTKSPPPVSMKIKRKQVAIPQPSRDAPAAPRQVARPSSSMPMEGGVLNMTYDEHQKKQVESTLDRRRSARNSFEQSLAARPFFNASRSRNSRSSLEDQQPQSSHSFHSRHSLEQHGHYAPRPAQQPHSGSFQDQDGGRFHQTWNYSQPRPDLRTLARASFDSSIGKDKAHNSQRLTSSHSSSQLQQTTANVDRYNGGLGYGYEPGFGIGGSAGMRDSVTAASRKGVEGSLRWGVDLSDVPIIVQRAEA